MSGFLWGVIVGWLFALFAAACDRNGVTFRRGLLNIAQHTFHAAAKPFQSYPKPPRRK